MSLKGKLPAVNRGKLKGYTLLKFSLITLSAPEWLVHSGGACCFRQSWLLASGISSAVWGCGQSEGGQTSCTTFGEHLI